MALKSSSLISQDPATGPSLRADESGPPLYKQCLRSILVLSSDLVLYLSSVAFLQVSDWNFVCTVVIFINYKWLQNVEVPRTWCDFRKVTLPWWPLSSIMWRMVQIWIQECYPICYPITFLTTFWKAVQTKDSADGRSLLQMPSRR